MSMPKIPDMNPEINISREYAINMLITSVALEEIALSHIINAEGEKIQYVLGTLEGSEPGDVTICDVLNINKSVEKTLKNIILTEMLLQFKLENAIELEKPSEEPETMSITVNKHWEGIALYQRPEFIEIYLLRNNTKYRTAMLDTITNVYVFENVPVYDSNGKPYVYSIEEEAIPGYTTTIEGFTITNTVVAPPTNF